MRRACVLGVVLSVTITSAQNFPPTTDAPTSLAPTSVAPTSQAPVMSTTAPTVAPGLFGSRISVEYGRPAWSDPTLPASASCPYTANTVGGNRTGRQLFDYLLATEGAMVRVQTGDTWASLATRVTSANLCNRTMDSNVSTEEILRYNSLHTYEASNDPPVPNTYIVGCGVDPILPQCRCPTNFPTVSQSDGLTCGTDAAGSTSSVTLNCPQRIFSGGSCGNGTVAYPAGYITAEQPSRYFVITPSAGLQVDLFIDFGVARDVEDFTLSLTRSSARPVGVEVAYENGTAWETVGRVASNCATYSSSSLTCSTLGLSGALAFRNGEMNGVEAVRLRFTVATGNNVEVLSAIFQGRCSCNGHASTCWRGTADGDRQCQCQHNTAGTTCDSCLPMYNNKPYRAGNASSANPCEVCECNGHEPSDGTASCTYSPSLGSGVCDTCLDNTTGATCHQCRPDFYRNPAYITNGVETLSGNATCIACGCDAAGSNATTCIQSPGDVPPGGLLGQCACKSNTQGRTCNTCALQTYNLSSAHTTGCVDCGCSTAGSLDALCHNVSGQCRCKTNVHGRQCDTCTAGYTNLTEGNPLGCELCRLSGPNVIVGGVSTRRYMVSDATTNACLPCHEQCDQGCSLPNNASACTSCKGLSYGSTCVGTCPDATYANTVTQTCDACHPYCRTTGNCRESGQRCSCSGPSADDCDQCVGFTLVQPLNTTSGSGTQTSLTQCLAPNASCPLGNYAINGLSPQCRACHSSCDPARSCSGPLSSECDACRATHVYSNNFCQDSCPVGSWPDGSDYLNGLPNAQFTTCSTCSTLCAGGCDIPDDVNRTRLASLAPAVRQAVTAAFCLPAGEMGCNPLNSFYTLANTSIGGINVSGTCVAGSTSNCPANTYFDPVAMARTCLPCDAQCASGTRCTRGGSTGCQISTTSGEPLCANFFTSVNTTTLVGLGGNTFECLPTCPPADATGAWYEVTTSSGGRKCVPCHVACASNVTTSNTSRYGCTDATAGGCAACASHEVQALDNTYTCATSCPSGSRSNVTSATPAPASRWVQASPTTCQVCARYVPAANVCAADCSSSVTTNTTSTTTTNGTTTTTSTTLLLYPFGTTECAVCHPQCRTACDGGTASDCLTNSAGTERCRNAQTVVNSRTVCVADCGQVGGYPLAPTASGITCAPCPTACNANSAASCCTPSTVCGYTNVTSTGTANATCSTCSPLCSGCTGPASTVGLGGCIECSFARNGTQCVGTCPAMTFLNSAAPQATCEPCDAQCDVSDGCTGPNANQCDRCAGVRLADGTCVTLCPLGTTQVPANPTRFNFGLTPATRASCIPCTDIVRGYVRPSGTCGVCSSQCHVNATCTGETANDCVGTPASNSRKCDGVLDTSTGLSTCVASCPTGTYLQTFPGQQRDSECTRCDPLCDDRGCTGSGPGQCVFCRFAQLVNSAGVCVANCSGAYYRPTSASLYCLNCNNQCNTCHGPLAANCGRDCVTTAVWDNPATGGPGCTARCSAGKYPVADSPQPSCAACHPTCDPAAATTTLDACFGPASHECRRCLRFSYMNATLTVGGTTGLDTCVLACPAGTYPQSQSNGQSRCTACNSVCAYGCTGASPAQCTGPPTGSGISNPNPCRGVYISPTFPLSPGTCVSTCPDGTYEDSNRICQPCDTNVCSRCSGPLPSQCTLGSCVTADASGNCVVQCNPDTQYRTGIPGQYTCRGCHPECASTGTDTGCTGPASTECRACRNHFYDGQCFGTCPGFFQAGVCVTACAANAALGTWVDSNRECRTCHPECLNCTGPLQTDCLSCRRLTDSSGRCVSQCAANERLVGTTQCAACHPQCYGSCTGPLAKDCSAVTVTSNRGVVTTRRCRGAIQDVDGDLTCVDRCPAAHAYSTLGQPLVLDTTGGYMCRQCETGFKCVDGRVQEPCPYNTVTCSTGSTACAACPTVNGHCIFNFNKGAMDAVQCDEGFAINSTTCGCVGGTQDLAGSDNDSTSGTDNNTTILVAVVVGGVAFLAFVAAIVYMSGKSDSADFESGKGRHAVANPVYAQPATSPGGIVYGSPYGGSPYRNAHPHHHQPPPPQQLQPIQSGYATVDDGGGGGGYGQGGGASHGADPYTGGHDDSDM
eukprot:m.84874 g.84874  ORF g.84874 m.84874 type:complete len:2114 (+) comp9611_c0_seq2:365-6706(+)